MTNKQRLKEIERKVKPAQDIRVVWEDPGQPGVFYDKDRGEPERKRLTEKNIKALGNEPGAVLIRVTYDQVKKDD